MDAAETNRLDGKLVTMIAVAVFALVAVVVGAFVLSYDALTAVAEAAHVAMSLSWLMSVSVDGAMTVGTMAALVLKMLGKTTGYAWFVVLAGVAISVACNALHATQSQGGKVVLVGWQAGAVSAIPAVALALSLHLLIILIEAITDAVSGRRKTAGDGPADGSKDASPMSVAVSVERLSQTVEAPPVERLSQPAPMAPTTLWGASFEASLPPVVERLPQTPKDAERPVEDAPKDSLKDVPGTDRNDREPSPPAISRPAVKRQPARPVKPANVEVSTKDKAMAIMKGSPEMTAADLARELGLEPSGYVRTLRREVLAELASEDAEDAAAKASKDALEDASKDGDEDAPTDTAEDGQKDAPEDTSDGVSGRRLHAV
ncbi:DUF2637 domain-containing protein [Nonomuraea sp. CA-143628]|uniref:DUF2637 domain-containing protein n=1 Tax=Nonomuraea sp. CA-143628 TaxID=3239997 RepID=UPI003D908F06